MRPDDAVFWDSDAHELLPGLTVLRCGGHFPGSSVLHWAAGAGGKGVLFTADTIMVVADRRYVTFMYSYPNYIPLPAATVRQMLALLEPYPFEQLYGAWFGAMVWGGAKEAVRRSAERYIRALEADRSSASLAAAAPAGFGTESKTGLIPLLFRRRVRRWCSGPASRSSPLSPRSSPARSRSSRRCCSSSASCSPSPSAGCQASWWH